MLFGEAWYMGISSRYSGFSRSAITAAEEPARLAARDAAVIEAQGQRHAPMRPHGCPRRHGILAHLAGAQNGDRRRHHEGNTVAAGEGAEIRQHQREVAQILRRRCCAGAPRPPFAAATRGAQLLRRFALDVAHHRHDQPAGRIDGDGKIDVRDQHARLCSGSYQAFKAGSARQAQIIARIRRSM